MNQFTAFAIFFFFFVYTQSYEKIPYKRGTICNIEAYFNARRNLSISRYFCVPENLCRKGVHRFPLMNYDGCDSIMRIPKGYEYASKLICCHQEEVIEDLQPHYQNNLTYLTGVKSFMMCKEFSHAICGPKGSYCNDDATEAQKFRGLPTAISKYPHTALLGYYDPTQGFWIWFCQGTIVSKTYILSVWSCVHYKNNTATNVKVGESRLCHLSYCTDYEEEQNLQIKNYLRENAKDDPLHDLVLLEVPTIMFNKKVRPACLFYQFNTRQTQGWFARYSKPESLITTFSGRRPKFMNLKHENITAFKVRTGGEARIMFSRSGLPYRKEFNYQIVIGTNKNTESKIVRIDAPNLSRPPIPNNITTNILNPDEFRGFWVHIQPHKVNVGKEDNEDAFLVYEDHLTEFNLPVMGISTPDSTGEWIIHDYLASASLHDFEVEATYTDDCNEDLNSSDSYESEGVKNTILFCVKGTRRRIGGIQYGPCNKDWGGTVQIMDERLFCMWQVFGIFMRENPRNCSMVEKPSLFKSLNRPEAISWLEEKLFPDFSIFSVNLERPQCVGPFIKNNKW